MSEMRPSAASAAEGVYLNFLSQPDPSAFFARVTDSRTWSHGGDMRQATLACVDEGADAFLFHLLGGGLYSWYAGDAGRQALRQYVEIAGIQNLATHEECGAAKLVYTSQFGEENPSWDDVNDFAFSWGRKVARDLSLVHIHTPVEALTRPSGVHPGRTIYVSYVPRGFRIEQVAELPQGFMINAAFHPSQEVTLEEVGICHSIINGSSGRGNIASPKEPILIVVIGHPHDDQLRLNRVSLDLQRKFVDRLPHSERKKVRVVGIDPPAHCLR